MKSHLILFPLGSFFHPQNTFRIQVLGIGISTLYPTTFPTTTGTCAYQGVKNVRFWGKFSVLCFLETPVLRFALSPFRVFVMLHFGFFCSVIATFEGSSAVLLLTFLLNVFWAIHQELFFLPILKKNPWWSSFGKVVGLQHPSLLKWNPKISVFLGVTDIVFWGIFGYSYYMESLQIIVKFCSSHLMVFLNMPYI